MTGLVFDIDDTLYSRQDLFVKAAESVLGVNVEDPREFVRIFYAKSDLNTAELSHHDPFDRILIAQAKHENYSLLSHDVKLKDYNEDCLILV